MQQLSATNVFKEQEDSCEKYDFTYVFETYYKKVYNYIYYRVDCSYTAEDLTSQVFEKVLLKINSYLKSRAPIEVWIITIAKNIVNDYFRKQKRNKLFSFDAIKEFISKGKNPEDIVVKKENSDRILKSLEILNKRERNIVAMKFGANLKNREIAEMLKITESNVGVILYRAMKKLKNQLEREDKCE